MAVGLDLDDSAVMREQSNNPGVLVVIDKAFGGAMQHLEPVSIKSLAESSSGKEQDQKKRECKNLFHEISGDPIQNSKIRKPRVVQ